MNKEFITPKVKDLKLDVKSEDFLKTDCTVGKSTKFRYK